MQHLASTVSPDIHQGLAVAWSACNIAVFTVRQWTGRCMLLCGIHSVDLASHSRALTLYEPPSTNQCHLAGSTGLGWPKPRALDVFHTQPRQTLRF